MQLPPPKTLKVLTAELTHNVLGRFDFRVRHTALQPWLHRIDFVLRERFPVGAIDVALFAVEVVGVVALVLLHFFEGVEAHFARCDGALDWLELAGFVGFAHVCLSELMLWGGDVGWRWFGGEGVFWRE